MQKLRPRENVREPPAFSDAWKPRDQPATETTFSLESVQVFGPFELPEHVLQLGIQRRIEDEHMQRTLRASKS